MPSSFLMCSEMVPSMSMMKIFKGLAFPKLAESSPSLSFLPGRREGGRLVYREIDDIAGVTAFVSKMILRSASEILSGSGCCQTFLPTASPAPPASMVPLTCERKPSSVGVFGPPDITTQALPAHLTAQAKLFASPLY